MIFRFLLLSFLAWIVWRWAASLFRSQSPDTQSNLRPPRNSQGAGTDASSTVQPKGPVQELVQCPKCETWKSATDRTRCGRADCPY